MNNFLQVKYFWKSNDWQMPAKDVSRSPGGVLRADAHRPSEPAVWLGAAKPAARNDV